MPAKVFHVGPPAHDAERQGLRYLIEGLDENFAVYTNPWIVDRNGAIYEVDAVVVAEHAIFVVEMKAYRGRVTGNDHDWYVPEAIRSPLKLNRKTAQILGSAIKRRSAAAGRAWVDHLVFLTHTNDVEIDGPTSSTQVHTKKTILGALRGSIATARDVHAARVDQHTAETLHELLAGAKSHKPLRRIREYELESVLDRTERYTEYRARHGLTGAQTGLRVYWLDPLATEETREKLLARCRWEAQVLGRIASHRNVLSAQPPFTDEEELHLAIPFELFNGVTLETWIANHRRLLKGPDGLRAVVALWKQLASAVQYAHRQGVVHRLLRPEVVLVENTTKAPQLRLTGFDLAKQLTSGQTVHVSASSLGDDRMTWAAPEVLANFSDAGPASDQFGLGLLLGWLLTGSALFESTLAYQRNKGVCPRLRDRNPFVSQSLDDAVQRMVKLRAADRFADLDAAIARVTGVVASNTDVDHSRLDPENLGEGTRIGADYEVRTKLGDGGLGTVYLVRHLVSGTYRALKIARPTTDAEDALRAEYAVLQRLHAKGDAPGIVRPIDLSGVVPDRLSLVMERIEGQTLTTWLTTHDDPEREQLRLYAEDLFAALIHLEKSDLDGAPVVHKDLKPDNLIVGDKGLRVIDFSLADTDDPLAGTGLYKDPSQTGWSHASDRYAAALCLHELYTGRHAFNGNAPAPDQPPDLDPDDLDEPGLVAFFRKSLDPIRERRHPSAVAMRAAFLDALGLADRHTEAPLAPLSDAATQPLSATVLHPTSVACLRRAGVVTQGDLVALTEEQLGGISGLGKKKARQVLDFRRSLLEAGVPPRSTESPRHSLWPTLVGDTTELRAAGFPKALATLLAQAGYATVGSLADATSDDLRRVDGVGASTVKDIVDALGTFDERNAASGHAGEPQTVADLWARATTSLPPLARDVLEYMYGFTTGAPEPQGDTAKHLGLDQPKASHLHNEGLERLDLRVLEDAITRLEASLDAGGGVLSLRESIEALLALHARDRAAAETVDELDIETHRTYGGLVRVLVRRHEARLRMRDGLDDGQLSALHRPALSGDDLDTFVRRAREVARTWPTEPEHARRQLGRELPGFDQHRHSPLALAERLLSDVRLTNAGELFEAPIAAPDALRYAIGRVRTPVLLSSLESEVRASFGDHANYPEPEHLAQVIAELNLGVRIEGDELVSATTLRSDTARKKPDPLPAELSDLRRTPEDLAAELLRAAADRRGYRLVVAPPESQPEIARSVARAIGADYVDLEAHLFERFGDRLPLFEEASRFAAQRRLLTREVEKLVDALVTERAHVSARVVLGATAILGTCGAAASVVKRLYEATSGGTKGFWALVIPGVVHQRQPWFNETEPVFHLEGQVLPLSRELPAFPPP